MNQEPSLGVRLTVELYTDELLNEWHWELAERLDDPGEGPGSTLWGDRSIAGGSFPTLDRALSAINTAIKAEIRKCLP
jgi:hypothetical protein